MKIANEFTVSAPIEDAWKVLTDLEQVIPLMPGAQMTGREGDDVLGKVKVKVGPVTSEFSGKVHFVEQDPVAHRAVIDGKGKEARGTGNAAATVTAQLHDAGDHTRVTVDTDLKVVGKLAQFGSGMLQQVSEKLLGQFVESLEAKLAADTAPDVPAHNGQAPSLIETPQQPRGRAHRPDPACGRGRTEEIRARDPRRLLDGGRGVHARSICGWLERHCTAADDHAIRPAARCRPVAAFAVALVARLRGGGVVVSADGPATFVQAMRHMAPQSRTALYWTARLSLVNRAEDLAAFDAVFEEIFADAAAATQIQPEDRGLLLPPHRLQGIHDMTAAQADGDGLPWTTLPPSMRAAEFSDDGIAVPEPLPSRLVARADESFDRFDEDDLRRIGTWLEQLSARWPRRRTMRREVHRRGKRIDVRESMRSSRETGWEVLRLRVPAARNRPRRVVLVCDVSRSMRPYATIYLHLMRAAALRQKGSSSRGLRVLDIADAAHTHVVASVGGGRAGTGQREGRRPLRRNAPRPQRGRATGRTARQRAARRGGDHRVGRMGQRPAGRAGAGAGPGAAPGAMVVWLNPRAAQPGFRTARGFDGGRAAVLRPVPARALD